MILHSVQSADQPRPSFWARVAVWFAILVLLCGSTAEAGHLHRLTARQGAAAGHTAMAAAPDGDGSATCLLCLLDGSALPVDTPSRMPVLYSGALTLPAYTSRIVPLSVPFALNNRPPPAF